MQDVSLGDPMGCMPAKPAHYTTTIAHELTVKGAESTTGEGKLWGAIMRKKGIRVLKERNQDEPVVNPAE